MRIAIRVVAAAAVFSSATFAASAQQAVQWKVSDGGNGHWYRLIPEALQWNAAKDRSVQLGGHLATLTSQAEALLVVPIGTAGAWLGASAPPGQGCNTGAWSWVTGEVWSFSYWAAGEPGNCSETGLALASWGGYSGRWNNQHLVVAPSGFVIEWSADCNHDGIVDYGQCRDGSLPDYNLNNIPDCCETGTPCEVGSYPVQWRVEDGGNGHWYQIESLTPLGLNWSDAENRAVSVGGHLSSITSEAENDFILRVAKTADPLRTFWIGGYRTDASCNPPCFTWTSGEPWGYTNWGPGGPPFDSWGCWAPQPNFCGWGGSGSGLAVEYIVWDGGTSGLWNDEMPNLIDTGAAGAPHIVEWSADCNGDGIVDKGQILQGQLADVDRNGVPDTCQVVDCNADGIADTEQVARGELADYNSNLVPDCCESGEPCVAGNYPVQWREAEGGNGHWYMAVRPFGTVTDWEMARAYASARGGYLVTVTSAAEQALIERFFAGSTSCQGDLSGVFLGGRQALGNLPADGWSWVSGEPWGYTNWASSEPNDFSSFPEDYLMMVTQDMRWYDVVLAGVFAPCAYSAVVEWSADCNGDGIADKGQILQGQFLDVDGNGVPDTCECAADVTDSGAVDGVDLAVVLGAWGTDGQGQFVTDIDNDGIVGGTDLAYVLGGWGPCQ